MGIGQLLFRSEQDTRPRPLRGLDVGERIDARGFDQVTITDTRLRQITAVNVADEAGVVDGERVQAWNKQIARTPRLLAGFVCDGTATVAPLLGGVFSPRGKTEQKDLRELDAALALEAPELYDSAALAGLPARPASHGELAMRCGRLLGATLHSVDELADLTWDETDRAVTVGSTPCSVFTLACSDFASAQRAFEDVSEAMAAWDADGHIWRTRWMRPFLDPDALGGDFGADGGRVWSTIVVAGGPVTDEIFVQNVAPRTRIRMQREWGRQAVMVAASLGLGVTGFQNTGIETELTR